MCEVYTARRKTQEGGRDGQDTSVQQANGADTPALNSRTRLMIQQAAYRGKGGGRVSNKQMKNWESREDLPQPTKRI